MKATRILFMQDWYVSPLLATFNVDFTGEGGADPDPDGSIRTFFPFFLFLSLLPQDIIALMQPLNSN